MNNDAQINHISDWNNYLSTRNRFISFYMDAWMTIATETMAYESIDSRKKKKNSSVMLHELKCYHSSDVKQICIFQRRAYELYNSSIDV